jgi:hypothetical protein
MNEYDPKPLHVLPLNYAGTAPRKREPGAFALGCITSLGLLIGIPVLFANISNNSTVAMFGLVLGVGTVIFGIAWSFINKKRAFGRGMIWGPLMVVCVLLLLVGICAMILR